MPQSLDDIMSDQGAAASASDTAETQAQTPESNAEPQGQTRDEQGRFASQQSQPDAAPEGQQQQEEVQVPSGYVPIQTLDARLAKFEEKAQQQLLERDRYWQQQLQSVQQQQRPQAEPPKVPDLYENPAAFVQHATQEVLTPFQQEVRNQMISNARLTAEALHGRDTFESALKAFDAAENSGQIDPRDAQRVRQSPNPFHEAVQWHKRNTALQTIGNDPDAWRKAESARLRAEIMAEQNGGSQQHQTQQPQTGISPTPMPSNFANARNAGPRTAPQWSGPRPLSELMPR